MKERLSKLLSVKSIVTLVLTAVFSYLAIVGTIGGQEFLTIFTVIISFYFGTQTTKNRITTVEPVETPPENVNATGFSISNNGDYE